MPDLLHDSVLARHRAALLAGASGQVLDALAGRPLEGGPYDTVVCAFVLCRAVDPAGVVSVLRGLLAAGGALHFLEHGLGRVAVVAGFQRMAAGSWARTHSGCRLDRDPVALLKEGGFVITDCERAAPIGRWSSGTVIRGRAVVREHEVAA
jgi:hypothetical protein